MFRYYGGVRWYCHHFGTYYSSFVPRNVPKVEVLAGDNDLLDLSRTNPILPWEAEKASIFSAHLETCCPNSFGKQAKCRFSLELHWCHCRCSSYCSWLVRDSRHKRISFRTRLHNCKSDLLWAGYCTSRRLEADDRYEDMAWPFHFAARPEVGSRVEFPRIRTWISGHCSCPRSQWRFQRVCKQQACMSVCGCRPSRTLILD